MPRVLNLTKNILFAFTAAVCIGCAPGPGVEISERDNKLPKAPLSLGERIYREGILPSGETMKAFVQGDVPVDGSLFPCESCHRRSGLGTSEGYVIIPPTNGPNLYRSRKKWDPWRRHSSPGSTAPLERRIPSFFIGEDLRPEYTDEALARVLRTGVDSSGRTLDYIMPRYELGDQDMALLIDYLKSLSVTLSPGVTADTIKFATVITEGVSPEDREAMLSILQVIVRDRNAQTRNQSKRAKRGAFIKREMDASYRKLSLSVWELKGPGETWRSQLEEYYSREPVFALLGGIAEGSWAPVHEFSEHHNVPCIFPVTDQPVIPGNNGNTLYFSKGHYQEGETAARYLQRYVDISEDSPVIQVFRDGAKGALAARGFLETWEKFGNQPPENLVIGGGEVLTDKVLQKITRSRISSTALLLWIDEKDAVLMEKLSEASLQPKLMFVSSGLLGENLSLIPENARNSVYITYPYSMPQDKRSHVKALETWLKVKKIPATNISIQSRMYFLGWMLPAALMEMQSEFYRDYFMETFEMMTDQTHAIAVYPRVSFGPGQRYGSKGCYIVQLSRGPDPRLLRRSEWVIQ